MTADKNPQVIVFDMGGVIAGDVHGEVIKTFAPTPEARLHAETVARVAWTQFKLGEICEVKFWEYLSDKTDIIQWIPDELKATETNAELLARLLRENHITIFFEVVALALRLKRSGYRLAVLSNHAREWIDTLFERYRLWDIFTEKEMIVISCDVDVRAAKPDPKIYDILLKKIRNTCGEDISPDEVIFIDDKIENVKAAEKKGIRAICYNSVTDSVSILKDELKRYGCKLVK